MLQQNSETSDVREIVRVMFYHDGHGTLHRVKTVGLRNPFAGWPGDATRSALIGALFVGGYNGLLR